MFAYRQSPLLCRSIFPSIFILCIDHLLCFLPYAGTAFMLSLS